MRIRGISPNSPRPLLSFCDGLPTGFEDVAHERNERTRQPRPLPAANPEDNGAQHHDLPFSQAQLRSQQRLRPLREVLR